MSVLGSWVNKGPGNKGVNIATMNPARRDVSKRPEPRTRTPARLLILVEIPPERPSIIKRDTSIVRPFLYAHSHIRAQLRLS
jgi:hypothetical protein